MIPRRKGVFPLAARCAGRVVFKPNADVFYYDIKEDRLYYLTETGNAED